MSAPSVGFIDDDYEKIGRKIGGIPVLGTVADIQSVCENNAIDLIYIAIPSIKNERRSQILSECLKTSCAVKTLPIVPEIGNRKSLMGSLRDITPEELLGREPVKIADEKIYNFVNSKTVLITGGRRLDRLGNMPSGCREQPEKARAHRRLRKQRLLHSAGAYRKVRRQAKS